ncbi:SANT associated, partial [Sesbania bispinosa]
MADSTPTATPSKDTFAVAESSSFQRTVSLHDWWLIKAQNDFQGKRLAVAGSSRKEGARRLFVSAPVVKRYDVFSLETADGIYVNINGFINEQRTLENGFAPEVFNHFLFGFPPNWESYALDCFSEKSTAGTESETAFPDNATPGHPEILSDGTEKSIPTSLASSEEALGDSEKPFPEVECNLSKGMSEVNVVHGSGRSRRSARLHNIKVYRQQKQPANAEKSIPTSLASSEEEEAPGDSEKPFHEVECNLVKGMSEVNVVHGSGRSRYSARLHNIKIYQQQKQPANTEKSIPTSLASSEEASRDSEKPFPEVECNLSKGMSEVNVVHGSGRSRRGARLHNIKVCQQQKQPASRGPLKHPDKEQSSTSAATENYDGEGMKSYDLGCYREESTAVIDSGTAVPDNVSAIHLEILSEGMEKSIPTSLVSPKEAPGDGEKPFSEDECNVSKEKGVVNVAYGCGGNRRKARARLPNIEACQRKKQSASACGGPLKHPDKEQSSTSVALENHDGEGLKSPVTPFQSQSKGLVNISSEQLVKKSASRISRSFSTKTKGCYKKKTVTVKTKSVGPKRKMTKSASAVKSSRERDLNHLNKGSEQKISLVSPESLSFKKSRSGRLLLPPLEFWRNQIPVYNADHELTEIHEGTSLVSPCIGPSPSLS